ncbi:MAG: NADH-quinone oxidoreductase subunit NuoE [Sphingomonadales bacterium]|jgi:NADH-quinone oxidoreductase E subunit
MSAIIKEISSFMFSKENVKWAKGQITKYPKGKQASAVMPLLTKAQEQNNGWLTVAAIDYVATFLSMPVMRVMEVATFYSMYNLKEVGKHVIEICTTTPCWLRGSDEVVKAAEDELGIKVGETTKDFEFTLREVECAGACVNAPVCSVHNVYYEDLTGDNLRQIIKDFKDGKTPKAGPQNGRKTSEPIGGATTLKKITGIIE